MSEQEDSHTIDILLTDDHLVVRSGMKDILEMECDMRVVGEASNGREAVELNAKLNPDIVLIDIEMPGMNGIEATRRMKAGDGTVGIIVLSAYDNEEFVIESFKSGAAGYLLKNQRGPEIVHAIRAVYAGDSVLHPEIANRVISRITASLPAATVANEPCPLTERELQIVRLGAEGLTNDEIAFTLSLSNRTVQSHWRNIFGKMDAASRVDVIVTCMRKNWI